MANLFILGAGFAKAVSDSMPLLADLGSRVRAAMAERWPNEDRYSMFGHDLELWLTYLSQNHPWLSEADNLRNKALLLEMSDMIRQVLSECEGQAQRCRYPDWLARLIRFWHMNRCCVITLNYDTLIERCAVSIEVVRNQPMRHSARTSILFH